MRQITRLLKRARLCSKRQQIISKTLKSIAPAAGEPLWRSERKLFNDVVERQRSKLGHDFEHLKLVVEENKTRVKEILSRSHGSGVVLEEFGNFNWSKHESSDNEKPLDYVKSSVNRRKQILRDTLLMRKEALNQVMQLGKHDVKERILLRRKLLQESVKNRKEQMQITEQKILEKSREILQDLRDTKKLMRERVEQVVEKENIYTIPNLLCLSRIAFSPYLGYLIVTENFHYAFAFMTLASISDWLDGWIARNYKSQSTKFGSFLDPMADKVLIGTLFLSLTYVELLPVPLTALIILRDVALVIAGFVIRYQSLPPPRTLTRYFDATHVTAQLAPTLISKINTGVQLALVGSTLAAPVFGYVGHPALDVMCYITAASTILAAASYITSKDTYKYLGRK